MKDNKIDHLEVCIALLSIFLSCCKITFNLSWLTCALGNLGTSLSMDLLGWFELSRAELLMVILFLLDIIEALFELFIASATSFTGKLKAARYYFLLSIPCE